MRPGDPVIYHAATGGAMNATVVRVSGTGPSSYKVLDLTIEDGTSVDGVPHVGDAGDGDASWAIGAPLAEPEPITPAVLAALVEDESQEETEAPEPHDSAQGEGSEAQE